MRDRDLEKRCKASRRSRLRGTTLVEYGFIAALIMVAMIASLNTLGGGLNSVMTNLKTDFTSNINAAEAAEAAEIAAAQAAAEAAANNNGGGGGNNGGNGGGGGNNDSGGNGGGNSGGNASTGQGGCDTGCGDAQIGPIGLGGGISTPPPSGGGVEPAPF